MDGEGTRVHVPDGVDEAHHAAGAAQVQTGQGCAVRGEVEEGVAGEHLVAVGDEPVVQFALLLGGGMQLVPHVRAATGGPQAREPQLRAEPVRDDLELVQLGDVRAGADHRQLEVLHPGIREILHRGHRGLVGARPADRVVDVRRGAVEGDLHVDVVVGGQSPRHLRSQLHAVG